MPRRPKSLVLSIDLGSSSVRTALFTDTGTRVLPTTSAKPYSLRYTEDDGVELAPNELLRAAKYCLDQTLGSRAKIPSLRMVPILAVGGSAFWHSLLGLDRGGKPITPVVTWADSRSAADADGLRLELSERAIQLRTGCMVRPAYWPAKLRWLRRTNRALFRRTAKWISPATWIFRELFGAEMTSHSMASGTGLYNLKEGLWDAELCDLCDVRCEQLGILHDHALTSNRSPKELRGIALFSAIGDGAAGNLGSDAIGDGRIAINIGTSAAARMVFPSTQKTRVPFGLFKHVVDEERVVIGGAISNGGNLRQWCLRELRLKGEKSAENSLDRNTAATDPLTVLPFWVSERAPTWPQELHGTITGLTQTTSAADILRVTTTSTFYRLADILAQLRPDSSATVIISGGILHSTASLDILADSLGRTLHLSPELESSLRGAAVHALENLGYELKELRATKLVRYRPALTNQHRIRRERQTALERLLTPLREVPKFRRAAK